MTNYLEVKNLSKSFDSFQLHNITFTLPKGYIMGLIGPNGSGKTTTIKLILNMLKRNGGEIKIMGLDNIADEQKAKAELGVVFDTNYFSDDWKVSEVEKSISVFYPNWNTERFSEMLRKFHIAPTKKVKELSKGMQMKLMLACAFSYDAKLLILDEPTSGLDPVSRDELLQILSEYIEDGEHSVLFSTHITGDLERAADYITYISYGELFFTGSMFRFYELMAPVLEQEDILYLGEGNTPVVDGAPELQKKLNASFAFKNDGQNPSASFKDRGMACAYSYLRALVRKHGWDEVLTICASTGDTSAAAALYGAYVGHPIKTAVLLPQGKVTPQQLSQPLGSGATVLEVPGVFDDCMKVVEHLAEHYRVALLNSKNSWRILGQESYAYEVAQWFNWDLAGKVLFVPVGNAGNITAVMSGLLKMRRLGIISDLPRLFGVQSEHADPVWRYYSKPKAERVYNPVTVRPSVAQAAMIGNPVSFPRVKALVDAYEAAGGEFGVVQVTEQAIMDATILANRHGHAI